jgi:hypothetical protein
MEEITVFGSTKVVNSDYVLRSDMVENSNYIFDCEDITNSNNISYSRVVQSSDQVFDSEFIYQSHRVSNSCNVTESDNIIQSNFVISSRDIMNATNVIESMFVTDLSPSYTKNINFCAFINHCQNLQHCLFCYDINNGEYLLFNKPISAREYDMIKMQMTNVLNKHELIFVKKWPIEQIPLDSPRIDRNIEWQFAKLPEVFWRWVKTLPGYDPMILYGITMQGNLLNL